MFNSNKQQLESLKVQLTELKLVVERLERQLQSNAATTLSQLGVDARKKKRDMQDLIDTFIEQKMLKALENGEIDGRKLESTANDK